MFAVVYRWRLKPGFETSHRAGWRAVTEAIRRAYGTGGSRLHQDADGAWIAYAVWPDEATWTRAGAAPSVADPVDRTRMREGMDGTVEVLHRLTVTDDLLGSSHGSAWDQDLYARAMDFAARAHGDQRIPGTGLPYVVHVAKVAAEVLAAHTVERDTDVDLALCCALLHDTMEDAGVAWETLRDTFGERVADGVRALSKDGRLPKADRMADSLARIREQSRAVWRVKLADRITNLEPPPPGWSMDKRRAYRAEAQAIHAALGAASDVLARRLMARTEAYGGYIDDPVPAG